MINFSTASSSGAMEVDADMLYFVGIGNRKDAKSRIRQSQWASRYCRVNPVYRHTGLVV